MFRSLSVLLGVLVVALVVGLAGQNRPAAAQDKKDGDACIIELYKDKGDEFRFRINMGDTLLATSGKGYKTKAEVMKVIDTLRKEVGKAKLDDQTKKN
jgi:uncharacterized protein YegP (UPF0339 family)